MLYWVLDCRNCGRKFRSAEAMKPALFSDIGEKPLFPQGGLIVRCPHCEEPHTYQRFMLTISNE